MEHGRGIAGERCEGMRSECEESATHPSDILLSHTLPATRHPTCVRGWSARGRGVRLSEKGAVKDLVCMPVRTIVGRKEREKGNILPAERKVLTRLACEKGRGVGGMRNAK
ncbi:hypothetical protein BT69DRAFT_641507 [Atractiella rhizophila]|nr:hypothetical protein BT69DRAFT_641507 [Atractiella rhizophila]